MIHRFPYKDITWIDVVDPTETEIVELMQMYGFSTRVAEELARATPRAKVDIYDNYVYLVLHFPETRDTIAQEEISDQEIDCIIGPEYLITVRYNQIDTILEFQKYIQTSYLMNREVEHGHGGFLFYHLINLFYTNIEMQLHDISYDLQHIESQIFQGKEDKMVRALTLTNRRLLELKRSLRFHEITLNDLAQNSKLIFGDDFSYFAERLIRRESEVMYLHGENKSILDDLRQTNDLLLNTKINNIMKILTLVSFITIPVIIGMEVLKGPIEEVQHTPGSIAIIFFIVCGITGGLWYYFKKKGWM